MKHIINISTLLNVLIITTPSCTMKKDLTLNHDEKYATFIDNNEILIHRDGALRIYDINEQKTVKTVDNLQNGVINLHPNKKQFALSYSKKRIVYDTQTGTKLSTKDLSCWSQLSCIFNPSNNTLFSWEEVGFTTTLMQYSCTTHRETKTHITNIINTYSPAMDIHPIRQEICVQDQDIFIYKYNDQTNSFTKSKKFKNSNLLSLIKYSPDGSHIACLSPQAVDIINPENGQSSTIHSHKSSMNVCGAMEFHPNNITVAVLSMMGEGKNKPKPEDFDIILEYLDIHHKNNVAKISLSELYPSCVVETNRALSFSPDGSKLLIVLKDKCVILPVPFTVRQCHQLPYFLFLIKNINQHEQQPTEIAYVMMQELLKLYNS